MFKCPILKYLTRRIASALNKIIHNSHFKRRISLEEQKAQKQDPFLRGRQIACLIYECFWVTGANDSVENCADLFTVALRNDDIQEFDSKWDGILLSMTKIPSDEILESLYKLRICESHQLKNVFELYDMEIHQKTSFRNYQKLKTMMKRCLDNTENFVPIVVPGLSSSSSGSSSTSRTPSRQENHCSPSSSSSSSSPTVSEVQTREREDQTESDISPVPVSTTVDERSGRPDDNQAKKSQKQIKRNPRGNRATRCVLKSWSGCKNSEKIWWMMKFLNKGSKLHAEKQ